uniref:Ciliogenesis-associated TTC17-interacting protein n=2 Tax=Macrostomum lignano TaxID=282301 RepID=A0A1I8I1U5_9PLAT
MASARAVTGTSAVSNLPSEPTQLPELEIPENPPVSSDSALAFLRELQEDDFTYLLFEDSLVSVSEQGKQLGEYKMSVEKAIKFGDPCLLVTASSHGLIDNVPCGTSISCYVTFNLETIEQRQHEYVKLENHPLDRRVDIVRCDEGLRVTKNVVQGERKETASKVMPYGAMEGFISEGANLLLQRLLITKIFPSFFDVLSFDSDSNLCQASYTFLGEKSQLIGGQPVQVLGVQRVIQSMTDVPTSWQTYFLKDSHLITRAQVGSPVIMKVLQIPELIEPDERIPKPDFPKRELQWEDDLELYSRYSERKEAIKADHLSYMRDHPELSAMMSDFLQHLLLRKPANPVQSAAEYFASFSTRLPPQASFIRSGSAGPADAEGRRSNTPGRASAAKREAI